MTRNTQRDYVKLMLGLVAGVVVLFCLIWTVGAGEGMRGREFPGFNSVPNRPAGSTVHWAGLTVLPLSCRFVLTSRRDTVVDRVVCCPASLAMARSSMPADFEPMIAGERFFHMTFGADFGEHTSYSTTPQRGGQAAWKP